MKKFMCLVFCVLGLFLVTSCNFITVNPNTDDPVEDTGNTSEEDNKDNGSTEDNKDNTPGNTEDDKKDEGSEGKDDPVVDKEDKEKRELYVTIPEGRAIKVLQLADIHFGVEGKDWHNDKVERTKLYISTMIAEEKPDVLVCTGDNILSTGVKGIKEFVDFIEAYETPWMWLYGNHDAENFRKSDLSKALMEADTEYLLYKEGYCEAGTENRYGNYSVNIYNSTKEKLLGAFVVMDSGEHDYSIGQYQAITKGQIAWYNSEIDRLQALYAAQEDNAHDIIPTIVFSHIQLPEYYDAYTSALAGNAEFVIEQELSASEIEEIKTGGPEVNTGFFDALVAKGSTKAYFVGHAHTWYFQVKYEGIVLGFGPQVGFSKLFANNDNPRKAYMYNISEDLSFTTTRIDEVVRNKGLVYGGTASGNAKYNEALGTYTFTVKLGTWNRVSLDYYGPELTEKYTRLTLENTTVTGEINPNPNADWTSKLYCSESNSGVYLCSSSKEYIYRFTYTVATNTLHIELVGELDMENGEITALMFNRDTDLSIWKKAGIEIVKEKGYATGDGKRLFIIVDAEGRIAYSVYNHTSTNGNPTLNEVNYYYHPYYANHDNPAIVITDTGYKIVIPEGGFAITADGDSIVKLAKLLINPSITSKTGLEKIVNNLDAYSDGLRLSYDPDTKVISAKYN